MKDDLQKVLECKGQKEKRLLNKKYPTPPEINL